jgi:hypothetical protein
MLLQRQVQQRQLSSICRDQKKVKALFTEEELAENGDLSLNISLKQIKKQFVT